jgi:hypothetical protein
MTDDDVNECIDALLEATSGGAARFHSERMLARPGTLRIVRRRAARHRRELVGRAL